jgi:hypothetical protein
MKGLFLFPEASRIHPDVETWMLELSGELGDITREWHGVLKNCGNDVLELLHDGHPTVCVGGAAFAYVNAFKTHVNVGFFRGAELDDPANLLEGTGKLMRHIKLKPGVPVNTEALRRLIRDAYEDMKKRTPGAGEA